MVKLKQHLHDVHALTIDEVNDLIYEHEEKETVRDYSVVHMPNAKTHL